MNLFGVLDVSASALKAERVRAEVVAVNMANSETTRMPGGGAYRRQHVVFEAQGDRFVQALGASGVGFGGMSRFGAGAFGGQQNAAAGGVAVAGVIEDQSEPLKRFDPGHPDAGPDGYVSYPDINPVTEMVDLMGASRAYGMNASAVQAEKNMIASSLELLK